MAVWKQFLKAGLTAMLPRHRLAVRGPRRFASGHDTPVALTFDDGPHPEWTPRLLDALSAHRLQATFFVVGEQARRYPHLVRRMAAQGHDVGNHTFTHTEPQQQSAAELMTEVRRTRELIEDLTGRACTLFRPPKGQLTAAKMLRLWREEQSIMLWSVDPRDYRMEEDAEIRNWSAGYRPAAGDIVLMHDNHRFAEIAVGELARNEQFRTADCVPLSRWFPRPTPATVETSAAEVSLS